MAPGVAIAAFPASFRLQRMVPSAFTCGGTTAAPSFTSTSARPRLKLRMRRVSHSQLLLSDTCRATQPVCSAVSDNLTVRVLIKGKLCDMLASSVGFRYGREADRCGVNDPKIPSIFRVPKRKHSKIPSNALVIRSSYPQNEDLPRYYSKKEKKPFPVPVLELRRRARERVKKFLGKPKKPVPPPRNGMLVRSLIPVAYDVYNARITLIDNLKKLLNAVAVHACRNCNEIHVGPEGHMFRSCRGPKAARLKGLHHWTKASVEDIIVPVDAYHLFDRLGRRITHEERFLISRIPAVVELCIQAGVDLPDFPTKRRRKPVMRVGRNEFIDANEDHLPDPPLREPRWQVLTQTPDAELISPSCTEETILLAETTLESWERLREGTEKLMRKYPVRVCGYCPEIHIGPSGHKAQNCGAHKHQQRNGQHGWQSAVLDDLIPPRYVWHLPDVNGPPLQKELRSFYGQAPAVVEMCVQGGAEVPEKYKPTMRLDIGIPSSLKEAEMVV